MTTDLSTLTRDQLERLAEAWRLALDAHTQGSRGASLGFVKTAHHILAEPRPAPVPTDREVVEAWVFGGEQRGAFLSSEAPHISLHDKLADLHFIWFSATGPDEAYAQAAAWVREQWK